MDLDQIAQRLEELSLDLECEELAALAEALIRNETKTCGPECDVNRRKARESIQMAERILETLVRSGVNVAEYADRQRYQMDMRMAMQYQARAVPRFTGDFTGGTVV